MTKLNTNCRVCGSDKLRPYLDLGQMPLANNLELTYEGSLNAGREPLQVLFCEFCSLSQLSVVVDPDKLYSYYTYRSSINGGYVKHCREMAIQLKNKYNLNEKSYHIDIAGNDGALLKEFKDEIGLRVLNVDPAENLAPIAIKKGVTTYTGFFSNELAGELYEHGFGDADLITATNVFAHVDDVVGFMNGAKGLLKKNGVLVLEFPYLIDFIENMEFDTIYFEHLSYFSLAPILYLCNETGMKVIEVEKQKIHGGTLRVTIAHQISDYKVRDSVKEFSDIEFASGFNKIEKYEEWGELVQNSITNFTLNIEKLKNSGAKIAAFAASAKGNTLLNSSHIDWRHISYIADQTPEKIGKYSPGTGLRIYDIDKIVSDPPDYLLILSWNFRDEIIEKLNKIYKGKYLIPIPKLVCSYVM